jgi:capsular exopolysaccharide synthesis family protein
MTTDRSGNLTTPGTVDLREFFAKIGRHKILIVVIVVVVTTLVMTYSYLRARVYSSTAEVLVRPVLVDPSNVSTNPSDLVSMATEKELVTSSDVAQIAQDTLGGNVQDLIDHVSVANPLDTQILDISYSAGSPAEAQKGAQTFATAYLTFRGKQAQETVVDYSNAIQSQIDYITGEIAAGSPDAGSLENQRSALQQQLATVGTLSTVPGQVIQAARLEPAPVSPKHKLDLALGLLLGLAVAFVVAYMLEIFRDRIQSPHDVSRDLQAPILGLIPDARSLRAGTHPLVTMDDPHGLPAETYRTLRTNLLAVCRDANAKTILITSARQGEGKTTTAANLAVALAQAGRSVLLVSADFRAPRIHSFFGDTNGRGLAQVLLARTPLEKAIVPTALDDLHLLPSGPVSSVDEPVEIFRSQLMNDILHGTDDWEFVVLDSPPIFPVADSLVLADLVDGVLFVTDVQSSNQASVAQARRQITQVGGRILGGALNRVPSSWSVNGSGAEGTWRGVVDRYILREPDTEELGSPAGSRSVS